MSSSQTSSSSSDAGAGKPALAELWDLECPVDVMLGHGSITVGGCLGLAPQSVVSLRTPAGTNQQIAVNGVPLALGEVLVVEGRVAIRVTQILEPASGDR
jgi:flagellar motor switch/type III secretory pathway protein FliN